MSLRRLAVLSLALLGAGVLGLMAWLAYQSGDNLEAAGWLTAGFLSLWSLCIGYSKENVREYILEQLTEYLDEHIDANYQELVDIFIAANPGFDTEKTVRW